MRLSGRFSEDERQKYFLIDGGEHTSVITSESQKYQLPPDELSICKELFERQALEGSCQLQLTTANRLLTKAKRSGTTGKLEVWRGHIADTAKTDSSFVKIANGDCFGRIAQIKHFIDFVEAEKNTEVVIATLFTNHVQTDVDCGLSWVDTSNKESKAFLLTNISRPMVTATDESDDHVLWLLNFDNV